MKKIVEAIKNELAKGNTIGQAKRRLLAQGHSTAEVSKAINAAVKEKLKEKDKQNAGATAGFSINTFWMAAIAVMLTIVVAASLALIFLFSR